jgi:hypothetical protein
MEDQTLVEKLWAKWCELPIEAREQVVESLGPLGNILSIAANVKNFSATQEKETDVDEGDVIDVEFTEL